MLRRDKIRLEARAIVGQGVHGALHEAEDRPRPQRLSSSDDRRRHLYQIRAAVSPTVVTVWKCLLVLLNTASASCSALVAGGTSWLVTTGPQ